MARHKVRIEGHGTSTVVFEAGLGDTLDVWGKVQPLIAAGCTRTIAYTRAGYPGSDVADGPRDAQTIVAELRSELKRRGIQPPYVLVGHSLGGLYMQYFARHYPDEVEGLLLVDSTHWNQQMPLGPDSADAFGRRNTVLFMPWIMRRELLGSASAGEQVAMSPHAGAFPTIVLSRTRALNGETPASQLMAETQQDEITAAFPSARHVRVGNSGHPSSTIALSRRCRGARAGGSAAARRAIRWINLQPPRRASAGAASLLRLLMMAAPFSSRKPRNAAAIGDRRFSRR
jgi:pimeloyl-ACP methyl ester carboxylesterase